MCGGVVVGGGGYLAHLSTAATAIGKPDSHWAGDPHNDRAKDQAHKNISQEDSKRGREGPSHRNLAQDEGREGARHRKDNCQRN